LFFVFAAWTIVNTIILGTVGSGVGGGFSKVVGFAGGDGDNWSKCPTGGNDAATVNTGSTGTGSTQTDSTDDDLMLWN
jgi:hypothetical protein